MVEKPNKLQPALIGGVILGLLASIPIVNLGNICCCLWAILGGAVAARMLINRSPDLPVTYGDGAITGTFAGGVGALIALVIGIPIGLAVGDAITMGILQPLFENNPQGREVLEQIARQQAGQSLGQRLGGALFFWVITAVLFAGFGALGGVIGVSLFEKRKG